MAHNERADGVEAIEEEMGGQLLAKLEQLGFLGEAFGIIAALAVFLFLLGGVLEDAEYGHAGDLQKDDIEADGPAAVEEDGIVDGVGLVIQQRYEDPLADEQDDCAEAQAGK